MSERLIPRHERVKQHIHEAELYFLSKETAPTEIYTLSLHDALPIFNAFSIDQAGNGFRLTATAGTLTVLSALFEDRKSTRLNSSHVATSYAVFCLKNK